MAERLVGHEQARIYTPPLRALTPETSHGFAAIAFAETVLGLRLMPWQKWLLIHALELDASGRYYRFRTVIVLVARQNGKTMVMLILALWHLYALGSKTVIGTAQDLTNAEKAWAEAVEMAQSDPELAEMVMKVNMGHPKYMNIQFDEDVTTTYRVAAASRRGARGFSGDLILMDELREHQSWDSWGSATKDLPNSTPMLRADGSWSTMGELVVGDRVMSPSGAPVTVTDVHPIAELRPMYRVTMTDGRSLIASESHLWTVRDMRRGYDMSTGWETLSTGDILARGITARNGRALAWRVPMQDSLDLPERDLPIDPYVLGYWLGDGYADSARVTVGAADLEHFTREVDEVGYFHRTAEYRPGVHAVTVSTQPIRKGGVVGRDSLSGRLRSLGVLGNKHVPDLYLTASAEQRLALLQGLLDSDGCATSRGQVKFTVSSEVLADAVLFLARSLGWSPSKSEHRAKIDGRDCGPAWSVIFTPQAGDPVPFRLPRKADRIGATSHRGRLYRSILSIEPVPTEPSTCIAVDSPDHLFTAGRDLVPTHNTTLARPKAQVWAFSNAGDALSIVLRYLRAQAHQALDWPDGDGDRDILAGSAEDFEAWEDELGEDTLGIFEWSAAPGRHRADREGWAEANPSMNHTDVVEYCITDRAIASALRTDPPHVFEVEVLCRWLTGSAEGPFKAGSWQLTTVPGGDFAASSARVLCVDVSSDRAKTSIARAGFMDDGVPLFDIAAARAGTGWVVPWLVKHRKRFAGVVVQSNGAPATSLIVDIENATDENGRAADLPLIKWAGADLGSAFGILFDRLDESTADVQKVRHLPHAEMDLAAGTAVPKVLAQGAIVLDRHRSPTDAAPLTAAIGALWGLFQVQDAPKRSIYADTDVMTL